MLQTLLAMQSGTGCLLGILVLLLGIILRTVAHPMLTQPLMHASEASSSDPFSPSVASTRPCSISCTDHHSTGPFEQHSSTAGMLGWGKRLASQQEKGSPIAYAGLGPVT